MHTSLPLSQLRYPPIEAATHLLKPLISQAPDCRGRAPTSCATGKPNPNNPNRNFFAGPQSPFYPTHARRTGLRSRDWCRQEYLISNRGVGAECQAEPNIRAWSHLHRDEEQIEVAVALHHEKRTAAHQEA